METSLHRQLKELYAIDGAQVEAPCGKYRIDVVQGEELIEIQHGSLAAIRDKIHDLLADHQVRVVKPIVVTKKLIKLDAKDGTVVSRRKSPKTGSVLDLFDELVYFTRVFPHSNLCLEVPLVDIEEWRFPGHGRRRRHRERDHQVQDQKLVEVRERHQLNSANDLWRLLPGRLPKTFHTGHLAKAIKSPRWIAQRVAYCLRHTGAADMVGKEGNALLYRRAG